MPIPNHPTWAEKLWKFNRWRKDPARLQAARLRDAFEAHGILPTQVPRLLPTAISIPIAAFSSDDELKPYLSPALVQWASQWLNVPRRWIERGEGLRHELVDGYKNPQSFEKFFVSRRHRTENGAPMLWILASDATPFESDAKGAISAIYGELLTELDGEELYRHWLMSKDWWAGHLPCKTSLLALCALALQRDIPIVGRIVDASIIRNLEEGKMFASRLDSYTKGGRHPDDPIHHPNFRLEPHMVGALADARSLLDRAELAHVPIANFREQSLNHGS